MGIPHEKLDPAPVPLLGFAGERVLPEGTITLPVTAGDAPMQQTIMVKFLVVKCPSVYNIILGRPSLNSMKAITSTYHLAMKFPTSGGVGVLRGDQHEARRCYAMAVRDKGKQKESMSITSEGGVEDVPQLLGTPSGEVLTGVDMVNTSSDGMPTPRGSPRRVPTPSIGEGTSNTNLSGTPLETPTLGGTSTWTTPAEQFKPVEELERVTLFPEDPTKVLQVGTSLPPDIKSSLLRFLKGNGDVFAWSHADMPGIDPNVIVHKLNVDPSCKPVFQKRRAFNEERYAAIEEEVQKLLKVGFIRPLDYPEWLANVVLVKKANGDWRVCIDFTDLNKACPKDYFPLPRIDQLVDSTAGHQLLSFMDAYAGYNQIRMNEPDQQKTAFITNRGLYCYTVMPFGLKNAGATYQRLVNMMFERQIGKTMEVYVDDMLVKSKQAVDHTSHLEESFHMLRKYKMKLNPKKCVFGVASGKFLGFMVNQRGIEANPDKIKAILQMSSPRSIKEVQRLTGRIAALNRFVSRATDKCHPFFKVLRGGKRFEWTPECEHAFQQLKEYLSTPPLLNKALAGEPLIMYLAVSATAVSSVLLKEDGGVERPIYYVSRAMVDAETRYPEIEKLALALMVSSRKLRPYFQGHTITVLTNQPLKQVLHKPDMSGRLVKWSIELGEFDIHYRPRPAIKGQALAEFVAEFTHPSPILQVCERDSQRLTPDTPGPSVPAWELYVDGSSNNQGSGAGLVLTTPEQVKIEYALRFGFSASNNEAEYEALLAGLRVAAALGARKLIIYSDSQLVVNQVRFSYQAKEERMAAYLLQVCSMLQIFEEHHILQIPRSANATADSLARLASATTVNLSKTIPVEFLPHPSTWAVKRAHPVSMGSTWMDPIVSYLKNGTLPGDKLEAKRVRCRSARYTLLQGVLYKRGFTAPYLRCLDAGEADYVMREVHEGICGNHSGGRALAHKVLRQGYYWPTLHEDALYFVRKCDKCQRFSSIPHRPPVELTSVKSPWPFAQWGVDIIGPLPLARGRLKFAIVAVDYFTKWVEAEALATITESKTTDFIWRSMVCRFGIPHTIVTDNGKQFDNAKFREFCSTLEIKNSFSSPAHPQANGQVEAINKIIKSNLKVKLQKLKGAWVDELPYVLWAYRMTTRTSTSETPFSLAYGSEAMIPVEVGMPNYRRTHFSPEENDDNLTASLDLIEELRNTAQVRVAAYQQRMAKYYNSRVKSRSFKVGDLVLRRVMLNTKEHSDGSLGPNWEGPYRVTRVLHPGTYQLKSMDGKPLAHPWNAEHLRVYYQ